MAKFRVGLTRDLLNAAGEPTFGREPFHVLDNDPRVEWEFLPEGADAITPADLGRYDALYVNAPRVAGDSFAGGFMGYVACTGDTSDHNLRRAIIYGSVLASFNVEAFSQDRLTLDE